MSKSPEDSRLSEHHRSFLEVVADFTDTSFRVHFHSFYDLSVINSCCFLAGGFQTLDFSMPYVFAIALIDLNVLLFSQSQLPHLQPGLCVYSIKCQNLEYRSNVYN